MAIQVRKKENNTAQQVEAKEAEVVAAGTPDVSVKLPPMTDKFLMTSGTAMSWMMENRRMIILCVSVVVVVCLGIIGAMKIQENAKVEMSSKLSTVFATLHAPTKAEAEALNERAKAEFERQGISADTNDYLRFDYVVPSDEERYAALKTYMGTTIGEVEGTELLPSAQLLLAGVATHSGDLTMADAAYKKAESGSKDIRLFALLGEAENLTQNKKYQEAIAKYEEIDRMSAGYGSYIRLAQGNLYELMGDKENAIKVYTSVFRDFNHDTDHNIALTRLRLLTPEWKTLTLAPAAQPVAAPTQPAAASNPSAAPTQPAAASNPSAAPTQPAEAAPAAPVAQ